MLPARREVGDTDTHDMVRFLEGGLAEVRGEVQSHTAEGRKLLEKVEKGYTAFVEHSIQRAKEVFTVEAIAREKTRLKENQEEDQDPPSDQEERGQARAPEAVEPMDRTEEVAEVECREREEVLATPVAVPPTTDRKATGANWKPAPGTAPPPSSFKTGASQADGRDLIRCSRQGRPSPDHRVDSRPRQRREEQGYSPPIQQGPGTKACDWPQPRPAEVRLHHGPSGR